MSASSDELPFAVASRPLAFGDELEAVVADLAADADIDDEQALRHAAAVHAEWVATLAAEAPPPEVPARAASPADATPMTTTTTARPPAVIVVAGRQLSVQTGEELIVGRRGEVVVDHPLVSRHHVAVALGVDGLVCRDLGSSNGTWVLRGSDRRRVGDDGCVLTSGDRVVTVRDHELLGIIEASR